MGNVTITPKRRQVVGNRIRQSFDLTFSSSYATNGDSIPAAELAKIFPDRRTIADLNFVDLFVAEIALADGTEAALDRANLKVKAYSGRAEVANATNLSAAVARCIVEFGDDPASFA